MPKDATVKAFHPNRSMVTDSQLGKFLRAEITGDLLEVPGIGPASEAALRADGITTTHQLLGKFLSLKEEGVEAVDLADRFFYWLDSIGTAAGQRSGVVLSIAEKLNLTFTGIYESSAYTVEEE